jgi:hypothetical protein
MVRRIPFAIHSVGVDRWKDQRGAETHATCS